MSDAVRLSAEEFQTVYENGFKTWAKLHQQVVNLCGIPSYAYLTQNFLLRHPALPRDLKLKQIYNGTTAKGELTWRTTRASCHHNLPPFQQQVNITVSTTKPASVSLLKVPKDLLAYSSLFGRNDDYIPVLMLAWAYILSARWTELMPGSCFLEYTENKAKHHRDWENSTQESDFIGLDLGVVCEEEAQWWGAVLALGRGWRAKMILDQVTSYSPWSIDLRSTPMFVLKCSSMDSRASSSSKASSFTQAVGYLEEFCSRHQVIDQSHAALAAIVLLPFSSSQNDITITSCGINEWLSAAVATSPLPSRPAQDEPIITMENVDKLLALSCNMKGIRSTLLSVFYNSSIECNAVTPWLQGSMRAIEHFSGSNSYMINRLCMERTPQIAFLWLGSLVLGLQKELLRSAGCGLIMIDLPSAAWTNTLHTFMQQKVSNDIVKDRYVSRADECRLLFLCQSESRPRVPVCQWRPFEATPIEDIDVEVRAHIACQGHQLTYEGVSWECNGGRQVHLYDLPAIQDFPSETNPRALSNTDTILYEGMDREKEGISENATRSIFGWLRIEGWAKNEGKSGTMIGFMNVSQKRKTMVKRSAPATDMHLESPIVPGILGRSVRP